MHLLLLFWLFPCYISKFLKTGKVGEFFNKVSEKVSPLVDRVKNSKVYKKAAELFGKLKDSKIAKKVAPKVKDAGKKVVDFVDTKGAVVESKVTDFAHNVRSKFNTQA